MNLANGWKRFVVNDEEAALGWANKEEISVVGPVKLPDLGQGQNC